MAEGSWGAKVVDELAPHDGEHVVVKKGFGGFSNTPLDTILRILNDEFDVARFRRELREKRLLSDYYLFLLSRRVRRMVWRA